MTTNFKAHLIALIISLEAMAGLSPRQMLEKSTKLFDQGHYADALKMLSSVDIRSDFDSSEDMKLAFKIRTIAYNEQNKELLARETIRELLFLDPEYQFNPFDTPAPVLKLAKEEKALIIKKNELIAMARNIPAPIVAPIQPEQALEKNSVFLTKPKLITTLLPFGINHFYQHSPIKGSVYLGLQTLGLLTNVGAFWWKQSYLLKFGGAHLEKSSDKSKFETAQVIQYVSLGSAIAIFCASVIDALIHFNDVKTDKGLEIATNP
ncbi:MAG TPA: hypothetical protein VEK06_04600 [Myxococcota bacterium]|nr:hypothetical protein [Myxococcota bacterium]